MIYLGSHAQRGTRQTQDVCYRHLLLTLEMHRIPETRGQCLEEYLTFFI